MKQDNSRMRCPLRNEWEPIAPQFEAMAKNPGRDGVMARLMLDFMPVMCASIERERDLQTQSLDLFDGIGAVAGAMIEEAIDARTQGYPGGRTQFLDQAMRMIDRVLRPRMTGPKASRLIIPGE